MRDTRGYHDVQGAMVILVSAGHDPDTVHDYLEPRARINQK